MLDSRADTTRFSRSKKNGNIDNRVKRVMNNLLPDTAFEGRYGAPQSLRQRMAHYHTPGASIAVVNNFGVEWAQGFGMRDARSSAKVTANTLFQVGSVSKFVFALGVMRLVQDGKLDLDEDVNRYLRAWCFPQNDGWQPRVTLRQLLSHTAGVTVHGFPGYQASETVPALTKVLKGEPPANTDRIEVNILPGMQFRYSGGGTTVAQQVLVDVLKKPFPQIMRELVLDPLGLVNSTYEQPLPRGYEAATAHPWRGVPVKDKFHTYPEMAAAGLWTTATDLARVGTELMGVLHGGTTHALLTKETIKTMFHLQLCNQWAWGWDSVGLGVFCKGNGDAFCFGHSGSNEGFVANMHFYDNLGRGAVVILNSNEGEPLLEEILRALGREYGWPEAVSDKKVPLSLAEIRAYAGLYKSKDGMQFTVASTSDGLRLHYGEQPPISFVPSSTVDFCSSAVNTKLRFKKVDRSGKVTLVVSQNGKQIEANREARE